MTHHAPRPRCTQIVNQSDQILLKRVAGWGKGGPAAAHGETSHLLPGQRRPSGSFYKRQVFSYKNY